VQMDPKDETGAMPSEELLAAMGAYNEELVKAGAPSSCSGCTVATRTSTSSPTTCCSRRSPNPTSARRSVCQRPPTRTRAPRRKPLGTS
jgi:hypothetical protein